MKQTTRFLLLFIFLSLALGASIFFSSKKIKDGESNKVVIVDAATPAPAPAQEAKPAEPQATPAFVQKSLTLPNCHEQPEYKHARQQLGIEVNRTLEKRQHPEVFAQKIDDFRKKNGLPLPLGLSSKKLESLRVVYNNCKTTCHGDVNQVFVSRIVNGLSVEVQLKNGTLHQFPIHESGLEVATIDELNKSGIPFRSWLAPMSDGPFYVVGNNLYYKLDMQNLSLEIPSGKSTWSVVQTPKDLVELTSVEPVSTNGCAVGEQCLVTTTHRVFKAPNVCSPAVAHASDELASPHPADSPYP